MSIEAEKQEPVPRVVLREGSPTLLSDKAILPTDQRLYTQPQPKREPLTDAPLYLSNLVNALDNAFISSWQSTADWNKELNEARDYLATHGIKEKNNQKGESN